MQVSWNIISEKLRGCRPRLGHHRENIRPEIVALTNNGEPLRYGAKVCFGPGLAKLRQWLRDAGLEVLIVNGEGSPPIAVMGWEARTRLARLIGR